MIIEVKNDEMLGTSIEKACLVKLQQENQELKNQQKEFIEYLENERNYIKAHYSQINGNYMRFQPVIETLEKVLEKYKEIIGVKDEQ